MPRSRGAKVRKEKDIKYSDFSIISVLLKSVTSAIIKTEHFNVYIIFPSFLTGRAPPKGVTFFFLFRRKEISSIFEGL